MRLNMPTRNAPLTHEGGPAKIINVEQSLRRSVLSCLLWEREFYEDGQAIAERIGLLADQVSLFSLANMMGALIAQPFLGRLANRFGPHRVLIGMSLLTVTTSVILYDVGSWGWSTALVALLWGATGSTEYATGASIAHGADHGRHPVEVARIALILNGLGGILGPLMATIFVRRFDAEGLYIFVMIVSLVIIIVMLKKCDSC